MNFFIPFYIVTFALIEWAYKSVGHVNSYIKIFDVERYNHNIFAKRRCRLLVNESVHYELPNKKLDYSGNYKFFDGKEGLSPYAKLKDDYWDNYRTYMRVLKRKYPKKKGLKKLDCYCEEKLFNAIENFDKISDSRICSKRNFCNILFKKFALRLAFFCFFVSFGIIIPTFNHLEPDFKIETEQTKNTLLDYIASKLGSGSVGVCYFLIFPLSLVIISVIIYTIKKIIKYDAIKAGNSKMKYKEYISFMKEGYRHK